MTFIYFEIHVELKQRMLFSTCFHSALWAGTAMQTETSSVCFVACIGEKEKAGTEY